MESARPRPLGAVERLFFAQNLVGSTNICAVVHLEGEATGEEVARALGHVSRTYPALGGRVEGELRPVLVPLAGARLPLRVARRDGDEAFRAWAEDEVATPYDWGRGPLARATLLVGGGRSDLVLGFNHAVTDGRGMIAIVRELFRALAEPGVVSVVAPTGRVDDRLPASYRGHRGRLFAAGEIVRQVRAAPRDALRLAPEGALPTRRARTFELAFDADVSRAIALRCRAEQASVYSAVAAATMIALVRELGIAGARALGLNTPVCLRGRVEPAAPVEELGVFLGNVLTWHAVDAAEALWPFARRVRSSVAADLARGAPFALVSMMGTRRAVRLPQPGRLAARLRPTLTVSSPIALEWGTPIGRCTLRGYRNFTALWPNDCLMVAVQRWNDQVGCDLHLSAERLPAELGPRLVSAMRGLLEVA